MYYRLDDRHRVVPATREEMYVLFDDREARRVAKTQVGEAEVSTVFLVIDHQFGNGPPLVFETMVFGAKGEPQWRYSTWDEAVAGHERVVAALRAGTELPE